MPLLKKVVKFWIFLGGFLGFLFFWVFGIFFYEEFKEDALIIVKIETLSLGKKYEMHRKIKMCALNSVGE